MGAFAAFVALISGCDMIGLDSELDYDGASKKLAGMVQEIDWSERIVKNRAKLELGRSVDINDTLPDIREFKLSVRPQKRSGDIVVEVFASSEKSGADSDGWLNEVAREFNRSNARLQSGATARVAIRKIASGTGYRFIASGKYRPHGFTPSNHLWGQMASSYGIKMDVVAERLVGNVAGVVMKSEAADKLRGAYGDTDVANLIDAVVQGDLVMGYTNPFASSTGLNFLITVLDKFSNGDPGKMLEPAVVSAFESFQRGVPFVALTTLQMRDSVSNDGSLDAFVMEQQTFDKTPALQSGYEFIPFGYRHDNPLYAVGDISAQEREALDKFATFAKNNRFTSLASDYGFNGDTQYKSSFALPPGDVLVSAQKIWKEKKDAGRPIAALFLADVSGSMRGGRIRALRKALIEGSEFINEENSIGLAAFSDQVSLLLPIKPFNLPHKASFHAAVQALRTGGNTAMYDGVAVALSLLVKEKERNPDIKPILFVLSDGKTNQGLNYDEVERVVKGVKIPVYTIGYEANLDELSRLSGLVEAASINADAGQISFKIGDMLNAQM